MGMTVVSDKIPSEGTDSSFISFENHLLSIWQAKVAIAVCAIVLATAGYLSEKYLLRTYETALVVRPQAASAFVEFIPLLQGTAAGWKDVEAASEAAYDLFLRNVQDNEARERALTANRSMFSDLAPDDSVAIRRLSSMFSVVVADNKLPGGKTTTISMRYKEGWRAAAFLNQFVAEQIAVAGRSMLENARRGLVAVRGTYERDLERLRSARDIVEKQALLRLREALRTAIAVGIDKPITTNLGTTAAVVASSGSQVPLYYYGKDILQAEIENTQSHIGNDMLIPELASIQSAIKDVDTKLAALTRIEITPVSVSESASDLPRKVSPSATGIVLLCLCVGGIFGFLWHTIRRRRTVALP